MIPRTSKAALAAATLTLALCSCTVADPADDGGGNGNGGGGGVACGNGRREATEVCDGADLAGLTCEQLGLGAGTLGCVADCSALDTGGCAQGCVPECSDRECGPDPVCGEPCGNGCTGGFSCGPGGRCIDPDCTPVCGARECGTDPACGASCGSCDPALTCTIGGRCVDDSCVPDCSGRTCGPDPVCGRSCGGCGVGLSCSLAGQCGACAPDCSGRSCGADPLCGTSCGSCAAGVACLADGQCEAAAGAPRFLSFTANVTTVHQRDTVIFSVVVTDPDGIDDLIGGTLADPGGGTYGTFATSATEGAYTLSLGWSAIDTVRAIQLPAGGADRTFRAEFYDVAGHTTTRDLTLALACDSATSGACDGSCYDFANDFRNCGGCGVVVDEGSGQICQNGRPTCQQGSALCGGRCVDVQNDLQNCGACNLSCSPLQAAAPSGLDLACDAGTCTIRLPDDSTRQSCGAACLSHGLSCGGSHTFWCGDGDVTGVGCSVYVDPIFQTADYPALSACATVPAATELVGGTSYSFEQLACICEAGSGVPVVENCTDGRDNDGDGLVDCADPGCSGNAACGAAGCFDVDLGNRVPASRSGTTAGASAYTGSCGGNGAEDVLQFTAPNAGSFTISTTGSASDTVLYVRSASCAGAELACNDDVVPGTDLTSELVLSLAAGQTVLVFVDLYAGTGSYTLTIN